MRVLLIEAGGNDRSPVLRMPAAFAEAMQRRRSNWGYVTEPEPGLDGRRLDCPRGKVLGGSSSINGMVYVRGHRRDFDEWEALGAAGWSYHNCLPYFRRAETWQGGADDYRGGDGPLRNDARQPARAQPPLRRLRRGRFAGWLSAHGRLQRPLPRRLLRVPDDRGRRRARFCGACLSCGQRRCGRTWKWSRTRWRTGCCSTARRPLASAFGEAVRSIKALAERGGHPRGRRYRVASVPATLGHRVPPMSLKMPALRCATNCLASARTCRITLRSIASTRCRQPITLNARLNALGKAWIGLRWALGTGGLGSTNHFEAGAFVRSSGAVDWPDVQMHFLPAAVRYDGRQALRGHGFQVHLGANKPKSRGSVAIVSARPEDAPRIRFQYLTDERDVRVWRDCIRLTRGGHGAAGARGLSGRGTATGRGRQERCRDRPLEVRNNAESAYHPCGACRMGTAEDDSAVVDPQLPRARSRRTACGRLFGVPHDHQRQSQRSHHHGRRTRRRHDPRLGGSPFVTLADECRDGMRQGEEPMKFGVCVATKHQRLATLGSRRERGLRPRLWVPDSQMIWSDCYATLALAAHHTSTIRLGTGVAIAGTRIAPVTAHSIASINRIAPGRVFLGIGTGHTAMAGDELQSHEGAAVPRIPARGARPARRRGGGVHPERRKPAPSRSSTRNLASSTPAAASRCMSRTNGPLALRAAGTYGDGRISGGAESADAFPRQHGKGAARRRGSGPRCRRHAHRRADLRLHSRAGRGTRLRPGHRRVRLDGVEPPARAVGSGAAARQRGLHRRRHP